MSIGTYLAVGSFLGTLYFILCGKYHKDTKQLILCAIIFTMFYPVVITAAVVIGTKTALESFREEKRMKNFDFEKRAKGRHLDH